MMWLILAALVIAFYLAWGWWIIDCLCRKDGEVLEGGDAVLGVVFWPFLLISYVWYEVVPKFKIGGKK